MSVQVTLMGNLTRDPEIRFTAKGDAVAKMSVAVNETVREGDKYVDGPVSYYDVEAWRKLAENAAENLRKGDRVIVVGKMKIDKYETKEGEQRQKPIITADDLGKSQKFGAARPKAAALSDDIPPF